MNDDDSHHWMQRALDLADEAGRRGEIPIGAVVVQDDREVGWGYNLREAWQDPTAHAEVIALRRAAERTGSWRLDGCRIYVTLEPCAMCAGALVLARIARCVYGCADPKGGFLGTLGDLSHHPGLNHRFEVVAGVAEEACRERLQRFFRELRRNRRH